MAQSTHPTIRPWLLALAALLLLAGGALAAPRPAAEAPAGDLLYALVSVPAPGTNRIYGFRADPATGALAALPGFPVSSGGSGTLEPSSRQISFDPARRRLYVLNGGSDSLSVFEVSLTTGALAPLPWSPLALGARLPSTAWNCVAAHPSGSPVLVARSDGQIASYRVDAAGAAPTPGSPFSAGAARPYSCAFSPDGSYFYAGGNTGGDPDDRRVAGFAVSGATGALTALPGSPFDAGSDFPAPAGVDAAGRLFVASLFADELRAFTTSGGVPGGVSGNPFSSGLLEVVAGALHPAGYLVLADRIETEPVDNGQVGVYRVSGGGAATTLSPVAGSPFDAGTEDSDALGTWALAISHGGSHLYAANAYSRNITAFSFDPATGALSGRSVQPPDTLGASGLLTGLVAVGQRAAFLPLVNR